ncbi:DUF4412 domain-containing protein [Echinicola sp. 20G]|uniref:DUF4412 domain-containing protein n=1 Tax=Echinicola sp. 20G TaxID=2781961 RepID=UPI0019105B62|nr:DUF4412 domain-containing protein [Echinicola sp. 20G]
MKFYKSFLIILLAFFLSPTLAEAQFIKKLKKAAQEGVGNAVERRVSKEVENAAQKQTDKYLEQIFGPPTEYEGGNYDYGKMMGSINMNVDTEDSYHFTGFTEMEISGTDEKGKEMDPVSFKSFLSNENEVWAMQMDPEEKDVESTIMIFDNKNNATILLMESKKGEKSRIAYGMDWSNMMGTAADEKIEEVEETKLTFEKTGNTKTILGYECEEYHAENDEFTSEFWVSKEPIQGYASYWSKNNFMFSKKMQTKYQAYYSKLPDGNVLEMTYRSKEDDGISRMKILEINTTENFDFNMSDYTNAMEGQN